MKRKRPSKLSLRKDTLVALANAQGGYCSNSTLSAQVSLCVVNTGGGPPRPVPECGPVE